MILHGWIVMDLCHDLGIGVFLDIPTRPAPVWLHKKYPSIDIVNPSGVRQNALTRYMEDVGDPDFQRYALRLAKKNGLKISRPSCPFVIWAL